MTPQQVYELTAEEYRAFVDYANETERAQARAARKARRR
jgi:hypothetical protein